MFLLDGGQGGELQGANLLPAHLTVVLGHLVGVLRAAGRGVEGRGGLDRAALLEGLAQQLEERLADGIVREADGCEK